MNGSQTYRGMRGDKGVMLPWRSTTAYPTGLCLPGKRSMRLWVVEGREGAGVCSQQDGAPDLL